jgi:hypothetical protein
MSHLWEESWKEDWSWLDAWAARTGTRAGGRSEREQAEVGEKGACADGLDPVVERRP